MLRQELQEMRFLEYPLNIELVIKKQMKVVKILGLVYLVICRSHDHFSISNKLIL